MSSDQLKGSSSHLSGDSSHSHQSNSSFYGQRSPYKNGNNSGESIRSMGSNGNGARSLSPTDNGNLNLTLEFNDNNSRRNTNNNNSLKQRHNTRSDGYGGGKRKSHHQRNLDNDAEDENEGAAILSVRTASSLANPAANIQSHNYEPDESEVWRAHVAQLHFQNRGQWWTTAKKRSLKRWTLTMLIGVIQAFLAFLSNILCRNLSEWKYEIVYDLLKKSNAKENGSYGGGDGTSYNQYSSMTDDGYVNKSSPSDYFKFGGSAFVAFLFFQTLFAFIASIFVFIEPVSGGSGIPEIKCFLNGINLPRVVRIKTLICKVVGVTFSVAAGLPVGKEGPMVHSGSVVAAAISQGQTNVLGVDTSFSKYSDFRNDREKRDFVACGAAAGVASAFGAPIGGVLFSLEEGASYWSTKLTWRCFFCAMCCIGTLFGLKNLDNAWGQANMEKLFSFGEFNSLTGESSNFAMWENINFMFIGCLGGLIGAVFNAANENLTIWRMKRVNYSKKRRVVEVICISMLVTTTSFMMPLLWNRCTEKPTDMQDWSNQEKNLVDALVQFQCEEGQYNEVASLIFTDADTAIKQLFHFQEAGIDDASTFSSAALFLFFVPYISLATIVYGIAVPSGLFVPSLLSGAAFGRLCGHLLHKLDHTSGTFADSGTYALMGAAAVLGGMARMTISLTVILLEATGDMQYVLPLMLTLMCARFTGNVFNEGLYDIHIKLKGIPFLEPEVPSIAEKYEIMASQVMCSDVKCLRPIEKAGVVYELLRNCTHGTFPIVDSDGSGTLYGTASRDMLCTLLHRKAYGSPDVLNSESDAGMALGPKRRISPLVQWETLERAYPKYPTIEDVDMKSADRNRLLDLRPYANTAPYTINETSSIQRTYRLFRTLGLRTLCVVNHTNQVVGIITRKDLLPEALSDSHLRGRNAHSENKSEGQFV